LTAEMNKELICDQLDSCLAKDYRLASIENQYVADPFPKWFQ